MDDLQGFRGSSIVSPYPKADIPQSAGSTNHLLVFYIKSTWLTHFSWSFVHNFRIWFSVILLRGPKRIEIVSTEFQWLIRYVQIIQDENGPTWRFAICNNGDGLDNCMQPIQVGPVSQLYHICQVFQSYRPWSFHFAPPAENIEHFADDITQRLWILTFISFTWQPMLWTKEKWNEKGNG